MFTFSRTGHAWRPLFRTTPDSRPWAEMALVCSVYVLYCILADLTFDFFAPEGVRSIAMSVCVYGSVCLPGRMSQNRHVHEIF